MECREVQERISEFQDGTLPPGEAGSVAAHIRDCGECARTARSLAAVREGLRSLPQLAAPPELLAGIRDAVEREGAGTASGSPGMAESPREKSVFPRLRVPLEAAAAVLFVASIWWAKGELVRLGMVDRESSLYSALATVDDKPMLPPRAAWPTWYVAANTGTLYARTRWDDQAIWFVSECHAAIDTDHRHPNAGNFVLSRGRDDLIVDPTPYGSQSTLTSNAPTVASGQLPQGYIPSQAFWSQATGYDFVTQRASGLIAARCDYADQYRFQHRRSDVPAAARDFVVVLQEKTSPNC